jgi:hypothetical protein
MHAPTAQVAVDTPHISVNPASSLRGSRKPATLTSPSARNVDAPLLLRPRTLARPPPRPPPPPIDAPGTQCLSCIGAPCTHGFRHGDPMHAHERLTAGELSEGRGPAQQALDMGREPLGVLHAQAHAVRRGAHRAQLPLLLLRRGRRAWPCLRRPRAAATASQPAAACPKRRCDWGAVGDKTADSCWWMASTAPQSHQRFTHHTPTPSSGSPPAWRPARWPAAAPRSALAPPLGSAPRSC